ncbi:MAG: PorT family protein [Paludibacteraceae bacterium]|nr:PorT family protein [Paludibacteraceae bacterium]
MKQYLIILFACVASGLVMAQDLQTNDLSFFDPDANKEEVYKFHVEYRLEGGYVQHWQHGKKKESRMYLNGGHIGMTFDFMLPYRFSVQTGLLYTIAYGKTSQKWGVVNEEESYAMPNTVQHRVTEHWLAVPIRAYYNIKLWKKLNLFFYGGPQLMIGLAEIDNIKNNLPAIATQKYRDMGVKLEKYNRFKDELYPVNIQIGIGGGIEWDSYRLQAGYDFGVNNQIKHQQYDKQHMWEWSWYVSFAYKLPIH